jgi:hypothetical protein
MKPTSSGEFVAPDLVTFIGELFVQEPTTSSLGGRGTMCTP